MPHLTYITYIVSALLFPTQGRKGGANLSKKKSKKSKKKSLDELEVDASGIIIITREAVQRRAASEVAREAVAQAAARQAVILAGGRDQRWHRVQRRSS